MYTSHIGKKFLELYNRNNNLNMTAKQYFEDIHFPLFYDNERYLHSPGNTPLFQLIAEHKTKDSEARKTKKNDIINKTTEFVKNIELIPDMSFAIGYPSADVMGTTSGQITALKIPISEEDIFASWIGVGFGIGVNGGLNILFDNELVFNAIEEGFKIYRDYVNENDNIKNKIETWNSVWFTHRLSDNYVGEYTKANFQPVTVSKKGEVIMERSTWVKILLALSNKLPNVNLTGYVYSFGQMNRTIGFIQFNLPELKELSDLYKVLFAKSDVLKNKNLLELYETEYSFQKACQMGVIGLRAMQPKDLKQFIPGGKDNSLPKLKSDEKSIINYYIYQLWIIAMLNNKDLLELAEKTAKALIEFIDLDKKVRMTRTRVVEDLLGTRNRKDFIEKINSIIEIDSSLSEISNELVNQIMLNIAPFDIPLFVTLLRFKYLSFTK
ncbi:MAG: hypothetical protein EPN82_17180 [Bacteroidetes bacterium]|nr:MAG: hypothetical protein EPN82_17180 [Bacteroidota bacterium]